MSINWLAPAVFAIGLGLVFAVAEPRLRATKSSTGLGQSPWLVGFIGLEAAAYVVGSPTLAVTTPILGGLCFAALRRTRQRIQRQRMQAALPTFTDDLAQQLRSGGSLSGSLVRVVADTPAMAPPLQPVLAGIAAGERLETALNRAETSNEAFRLVLLTIGLLVVTGGPAAQTIERMGENVRAVIASQEEAKALAGQGTASAIVLAVLPVLFGVLAAMSDPALANFYAFEWLGAACVGTSVLLSGVAWFWMDVLLWGND